MTKLMGHSPSAICVVYANASATGYGGGCIDFDESCKNCVNEVDTDVNVIIVGKFYDVLQQHPAADSHMVSIWNWNKIQTNSTFFGKEKK